MILIVLAITVTIALVQLQPPSVRPADADSTLFSAERAMNHVRNIAARPHPVGSAENARVREYLLKQLRSLGLDPTIQNATAAVTFDVLRAAMVQNIIARVKGTANSKAVLVAAHYDSAPSAPGASDDAYAVAAILETLRALKSRPPLKNDLIILFTDGEEPGLLGAKGFVENSPVQDEIGFVMNFEARGTSGPSIMFETNEENGWVVQEYRKAASYIVAYSLTYELYKLLPNNTDFTILKRKSASGLNFAHIGSVKNYHSVFDDSEHLDKGTVQHHGSTMLACTLHFGNLDLSSARSTSVIYFPFLFPGFVIYPVSWVMPLTILATIFFLLVLVMGFKKGELRFWRLVLSFLIFLIRVAVVAGIVFFLWKWLGPLQPEFGYFYLDTIYHGGLYIVGFIALGILVVMLFHHLLVRKLGAVNLAMGGLFLWIIFTWGATLYFRGGSYLFVWPLFFALGGVLYWMMTSNEPSHPLRRAFVLSVCAMPGVFLFTQLLFLLYEAMTLLIVAGLIGLVALLLGAMQLQLSVLTERKPWLGPILALIVTMTSLGTALLKRDSSVACPKPNSVFYALNADSGHAIWGTWDATLDAWTGQFFSVPPDTTPLKEFFPVWPKPLLHTPAPQLEQEAPEVTVISDTRNDSLRTMRLQVRSLRPSDFLSMNTEPGRRIFDVRVNGVAAQDSVPTVSLIPPSDRRPWILYFFGNGEEGFTLDLTTDATVRLVLRVVDRSDGLPAALDPPSQPRPATMMPRAYYVTDATLVGKTYRF